MAALVLSLKNVLKETIVRLASIIVNPDSTRQKVSKALSELVLGIAQYKDSPRGIKQLLDEGKITAFTYVTTKGIQTPEVVDTAQRVIEVYGPLSN